MTVSQGRGSNEEALSAAVVAGSCVRGDGGGRARVARNAHGTRRNPHPTARSRESGRGHPGDGHAGEPAPPPTADDRADRSGERRRSRTEAQVSATTPRQPVARCGETRADGAGPARRRHRRPQPQAADPDLQGRLLAQRVRGGKITRRGRGARQGRWWLPVAARRSLDHDRVPRRNSRRSSTRSRRWATCCTATSSPRT